MVVLFEVGKRNRESGESAGMRTCESNSLGSSSYDFLLSRLNSNSPVYGLFTISLIFGCNILYALSIGKVAEVDCLAEVCRDKLL